MLISDNNAAIEPWFLELGGMYPSALPETRLESLRRLTRDVVASFEGVIRPLITDRFRTAHHVVPACLSTPGLTFGCW